MLTKTEAIIIAVGLVVAFAFGRYSAQQTPSQKVVETSNSDVKKNQKVDDKKKTTITKMKKPDGTITTITTVDEDKQITTIKDSDTTTKNADTTISSKVSKLNVSVLGANDFSRGLLVPTYGLSVSKEVLGPVTIGAFGLMNGVVGISIGLDF